MKLLRRGSAFHLRRRVPLRFREVEPREHVSISLHTDSEKTAKEKAAVVWAEMIDAWEAKLDGATDEGATRLAAAKRLAQRRGRTYFPVEQVAKLPLDELLDRVMAVVNRRGEIDMAEAEALLGGVPAPTTSVSDALDEFWRIEAIRFKGKSEDQIRRAKNPRIKAISNFVQAVGDKPYLEVTTSDLQTFKRWWKAKILAENLTANSANKDFTYLTSTLRAVATDAGALDKIQWDTRGLALPQDEAKTRRAFSTAWISDKLLAPGALAGLNGEARAILIGMVNTGYRPSEGAGLTRAQIRLDANVPHISIEPVGRTLKTASSRRVIPLLGVSLEAFREYPDGFPRYANSPSLTDTINKFLRENGLLESEEHTLYGLRHSFEDRMLAAGIDERIRRDLMGHSLNRERYGEGASLDQLQALLKPLAL